MPTQYLPSSCIRCTTDAETQLVNKFLRKIYYSCMIFLRNGFEVQNLKYTKNKKAKVLGSNYSVKRQMYR